MPEAAVALLHGGALVGALSDRLGCEVAATTPEDHLEVATRLGAGDRLVIGVATTPWPTVPDVHAEGSATLPAYTGVVSWHALPDLHQELAQAVAPAAASGAHVLITAPDPGPETDPADVMFLREVAEGVAARVELPSRSIAWRGSQRTPTSVTALESLVDAHGRRDVVECPVAPGTGPDPALRSAAEGLGVRLTTADLGTGTLLELLARVVRTVGEHEGLDG